PVVSQYGISIAVDYVDAKSIFFANVFGSRTLGSLQKADSAGDARNTSISYDIGRRSRAVYRDSISCRTCGRAVLDSDGRVADSDGVYSPRWAGSRIRLL